MEVAMSVAHILQHKGHAVITAKPTDSVKFVAELLSSKRIGAVVVSADGAKIDGIVSERDVVHALAQHGAASLGTAISTIMSKNVQTCEEADSETELMALMTQNRIRHIPVVAKGKLIGMVSIGDVVKLRVEQIERDAADMKAYIAGG